MEQITPEQALNILAQVANQTKFTFQEGDVVRQSIQVLNELIQADIARNNTKDNGTKDKS